MGYRYVMQLLFEWKITKLLITQQLLKLEKNKHILGILRILGKEIWYVFTKFRYNQILLNKIGHMFVLPTKLFTGWKSLSLICYRGHLWKGIQILYTCFVSLLDTSFYNLFFYIKTKCFNNVIIRQHYHFLHLLSLEILHCLPFHSCHLCVLIRPQKNVPHN